MRADNVIIDSYMAGRVTLVDFMQKMDYEGYPIYQSDEMIKKSNKPFSGYWDQWTFFGRVPWMPLVFGFEVPTPEPLFYSVVDGLCGTAGLWWTYIKVREGISVSPLSPTHGTILMKQSYQRKDAKEMLATVQTLKTVILNLESDLEKLKEQKKAFDDKDMEAIKGLFVDNYGGATRNWTTLARSVPIVKSALTWFYRIQKNSLNDMTAEVDEYVNKGELNPAVANYLKRKVQEYWNWRSAYIPFLQRTYHGILQNIRSQRANLQLYMRWASRNIQEVENMIIPYEEMKHLGMIFDEEFPQFGAKLYTLTEQFYQADNWPQIRDLCRPWIPCISSILLFAYNPDLPQYKFCRGYMLFGYGSMKGRDLEKLQARLKKQNDDFIELMKSYGGYSDEQLSAMGLVRTEEEVAADRYHDLLNLKNDGKGTGEDWLTAAEENELKALGVKIGAEIAEKGESPQESETSLRKEFKDMLSGFKIGGGTKGGAGTPRGIIQKTDALQEGLINTLKPLFYLFGSDLIDRLDSRKKRSDWIAQTSMLKFYNNFKKNQGWLTWG